MNFQRNNLDKAGSQYLREHRNNPIWWQEWNKDTLEHAKASGKPLFVSVGYASCHWCHVMAHNTFENAQVAEILNEHFVPIKVDREQRPDIDEYLMSFLVQTQGSGGWPLNVVLSPDHKPIAAFTYLPPQEFAAEVQKAIGKEGSAYRIPITVQRQVPEQHLVELIESEFNAEGGFGSGPRFPPHSTLLFLMHYYECRGEERIRELVETTLDTMATRGLHDHLQGGFFRYCTDKDWTIPHFEKMLYDQALFLWSYSIASRLFSNEFYRGVVQRLIVVLSTFESDGLFFSSHDADVANQEGWTYLWEYETLKHELTPAEFRRFTDLYIVTEAGNFHEKNHLLKKRPAFLPDIEEKLLRVRNERLQPPVDRKIITSWNALAGIGLLMAYRHAGYDEGLGRAQELFGKLLKLHYINGRLCRSSMEGKLQEQEFLEDYAAVLLLATFLEEEAGGYLTIIKELLERMAKFKDSMWYESRNPDFMPVPASSFDHPLPSPSSLAEYATLRARIILGREYGPREYVMPLHGDFLNIAVLAANGGFHLLHVTKRLPWGMVPLNSIQIIGDQVKDCFEGVCNTFGSEQEMIEYLATC
jgi:uncharacterized protein YyaL (SSP411 family)